MKTHQRFGIVLQVSKESVQGNTLQYFDLISFIYKGECVEKYPNTNVHRHYSGADTPANCTSLGGEWVDFHNYLEIGPQTTEAACNAAGPK